MTGSTAPTDAEQPVGQGFCSPIDWRDEVLYSVMLDRFSHARFSLGHGDPADGNSRHGGNLPGLTSRLDYLAELGVTAVQLSPVLPNEPMSYHGYGPLHLMAVDDALGAMADLSELVEQAHRRGIRIVLDLVLNHVAQVFDYPDGDHFRATAAPDIRWLHDIEPAVLSDPAHFTRRGMIRDWKDEEQAVRGDFPPGLRRLASENPWTADLLIGIARWWVQQTDADGVRVDAIRHLDPGFVTRLCFELRQFAAGLGKHNFLILGEYSTTADAPLAGCAALGVESVYLYPEYRRQSWALHGRAPAADLAESTVTGRRVLGEHGHDHGVRFIDNHDVFRFLRAGEPRSRLHAALGFCLLSPGIPLLYYGTEQAFRQATQRLERECSADRAAPHNREDMFADGAFTSASSAGEKFDTASPTFRWTRQLIAVRRALPALRRGRHTQRWADPDGPGIYAFSRHTAEQEVLVAINTADTQRSADIPVGALLLRSGALVDVLNPLEPFDSTASWGADEPVLIVDGTVQLRLGPHQVRVLRAVAPDAHNERRGELTPSLISPGAVPTIVIWGVTPTVNESRLPAKAVVGQALPVGATVWWHGTDPLLVLARFTGPDGTEKRVTLTSAPGLDHYTGTVTPSAPGWWTLRIEARPEPEPDQPRHRVDVASQSLEWVLDAPRPVFAEPEQAAAGAWYSLFPRSTGGCDQDGNPVHGTLGTAAAALPHIAALGFDVVHLTPIHPIGVSGRKGRGGMPIAGPSDPGCPWAIGGATGGHDAVHPELGDVEDVRRFVNSAAAQGIRVAMELAVQCSPDHPWLAEHPRWAMASSSGSVIADNGWTDIVPLDFAAEPAALVAEVLRIVEFWIACGIRMFRVDNPHTKPASMWHHVIWQVKRRHPDVVFLAEAFTRQALQECLSALGFSQTLTYFMWRESKDDLTSFGQQLARLADIMRPNLFPANHDVLPTHLRHAGPTAFAIRAALAATLAASWGIPSGYELGENEPADSGRGWRDSEKFQLRARDLAAVGDGLLPRTIRQLNAARRAHPALRQLRGLRFTGVDNAQLIAFLRRDDNTGRAVLCVVTLDADATQHGSVDVNGLADVADLHTGQRAGVVGGRMTVSIDPRLQVVQLFTATDRADPR